MPGSGLGLSIVRQVAERHSGTVHAGSAPGGGARLSLTLPGHPEPDPDPDPGREAADARGPLAVTAVGAHASLGW